MKSRKRTIAIAIMLGSAVVASPEKFEARGKSTSPPPWFSATQLGGRLTVLSYSGQAFTRAAPELPLEERQQVAVGRVVFNRIWGESVGLGPKFNEVSCANCHVRNGKGAVPNPRGDGLGSMILRLAMARTHNSSGGSPHPHYGIQLRTGAIDGIQADGKASIIWNDEVTHFGAGLVATMRRPFVHLSHLSGPAMGKETIQSLRAAPIIIGLGLLEAIPERDIIEGSRATEDEFGIKGRPNWVWNERTQMTELGRFGWKAEHADLRSQITAALSNDFGVTSADLSPPGKGNSSRSGSGHLIPEISQDEAEALMLYVRTLSVPARINPRKPEILRGATIFEESRCAKCHTPSFRTGTGNRIPQLDRQEIYPFTDLLLHDMGDDLADRRDDSSATTREWRTPPLWGLGLIKNVGGEEHYLHDGRARSVTEAILWHGGEGAESRNRFRRLSPDDRKALIAFLGSL